MGIRLIVEVMDHAPAELTAAERMVLVVIAENANDGDPKRASWPGFNVGVLAKRSGLTGDALKKALQRLAGRGMEVRIPIATGKDGRPLFAVPGKQCRYRLPVFEGGTTVSPSSAQGGIVVPAAGTVVPPKGGTDSPQPGPQSPPTPHPSSKTPPPTPPSPPAAPAPDGREGGGIAALPDNHRPAYDALLRITTLEPRLTIGEREAITLLPLVVPWLERTTAEALREALTAGLPAQVGSPVGLIRTRLLTKLPPARAAPAAAPGLPPWCEKCGDGNDAAERNPKFRRLNGGPCPNCHPDAAAAA